MNEKQYVHVPLVREGHHSHIGYYEAGNTLVLGFKAKEGPPNFYSYSNVTPEKMAALNSQAPELAGKHINSTIVRNKVQYPPTNLKGKVEMLENGDARVAVESLLNNQKV